MAYLGLDLGSKTLGIAISTSGIIASNLETFRFGENRYNEAIEYLCKVIDEYKITVVILGNPKHMNGSESKRSEISKKFMEMILKNRDIIVQLWDERLSTKGAFSYISGGNKIEKKKNLKDEIAAVIILQNYLDYKNKGE